MAGMTSQTDTDYIPRWTIADRLRRIRRDAGLTQNAFAASLDVKEKRYSAWESETNTPGGNALMALASRIQLQYGVQARDFLLGMEPAPTTPDGPGHTPEPTEDSPPQPAANSDELARLTALKKGRTRSGAPTRRYVAAA